MVGRASGPAVFKFSRLVVNNIMQPDHYSFSRYLAAKQALDDRSLNRSVREALVRAVGQLPEKAPLKVLEVGCGIGTMIERLLDWGLLGQAVYTAIDLDPENIAAARARLKGLAPAPGAAGRGAAPLVINTPAGQVQLKLEAVDLARFCAREPVRAAFDLLLAHAFLDLIDLPTALPPLLALLRPGGLFYFTLNFDGATILEPALNPELDRQIEILYHQSMDRRRIGDQPAGASCTGRRLFRQLAAAGATVAAAGSSDWVVFPGVDGYPGDEAYFLHFLVDTMRRALTGEPTLDPALLRDWIEARHAQIEARQLIYIAHQLDFFGYICK
jgi:SAM-dependent methyltransferase